MNKQVRDRIEAYLNGSPSESELRLLLDDAERSAAVPLEIAKARDLIGLVYLLEHEDALDESTEGVMQAIRAEAQAAGTADFVVGRIRSRRRVAVLLSLFAAAAALVFGVFLLRDRSASAVDAVCAVAQIGGQVDLIRADRVLPLEANTELLHGDWLIAGRGGSADFVYSDETRCSLGEQSKLQIRRNDQGKLLVLEAGEVFLSVSPQPADKPFLLETANASIRVVGTAFGVTAGPRQSRLEVISGVVEIGARGAAEGWRRIEAGQSAEVQNDEVRVQVPLDRPPSDGMKQAHAAWLSQREAWLADPDLVAYYDFQPDAAADRGLLVNRASRLATDFVYPRNADGRIHQGTWSSGRYPGLNKSLFFDGRESMVDTGSAVPQSIRGAVSVVAWFKVQAFDRKWQAVVGTGVEGFGIQRLELTDSIQFYYFADGRYHNADGKVPVRDGKWHCAVGVFDGGYSYLYVDGVLDVKVPASGQFDNRNDPFLIGANVFRQVNERHFCGWIDEVAVFNRALSATDVEQIWRQQQPR